MYGGILFVSTDGIQFLEKADVSGKTCTLTKILDTRELQTHRGVTNYRPAGHSARAWLLHLCAPPIGAQIRIMELRCKLHSEGLAEELCLKSL